MEVRIAMVRIAILYSRRVMLISWVVANGVMLH